jgi:DNA invertase Pin-like site-specific DNA recombinase
LAIERAATARGDAVDRWYCEKRNASTLEREALAQLRADVKAGEISKLYVFKIDRLSRSGIRDTLAVVHELRHHGCKLAAVADAYDVDGPGADIALAVMAGCAQMERQSLGDRISAARARIEAAGGRWGRPRKVDPETARRARIMKRDGWTIRQISAALKIPRSTIARAVSRKGHYSRRVGDPAKSAVGP